jgi:hypothetical protein
LPKAATSIAVLLYLLHRKGNDMATKKAFKPCEGCPTPAKCKAAGKCLAKEGKGGKPVVAIMIGVGKPVKAKKK